MILNITHLEFCSSTTNLKEPPEGSGHFQEAVGEVCSIIGNYSQIDLITWLQYEHLLDDLVSFLELCVIWNEWGF